MPGVSEIREKVRALRAEFEAALREAEAGAASALQAVRDRFLGRKSGAVTALLKSLAGLGEESRREGGRELNALKDELETRLESARARREELDRDQRLARERVDLTLPGRRPSLGRLHPLTATRHA